MATMPVATMPVATIMRQRSRSRSDGSSRPGLPATESGTPERGTLECAAFTRREPSLPTLRSFIEASGQVLAVQVAPNPLLDLPDTALGRVVRRHRGAVCRAAARHGAINVRLFGSVARGDDEPGSGIDLVVDLPKTTSLLELIALRRELAEILDAPVDVVPARSLRPEVAAEVERKAIRL